MKPVSVYIQSPVTVDQIIGLKDRTDINLLTIGTNGAADNQENWPEIISALVKVLPTLTKLQTLSLACGRLIASEFNHLADVIRDMLSLKGLMLDGILDSAGKESVIKLIQQSFITRTNLDFPYKETILKANAMKVGNYRAIQNTLEEMAKDTDFYISQLPEPLIGIIKGYQKVELPHPMTKEGYTKFVQSAQQTLSSVQPGV